MKSLWAVLVVWVAWAAWATWICDQSVQERGAKRLAIGNRLVIPAQAGIQRRAPRVTGFPPTRERRGRSSPRKRGSSVVRQESLGSRLRGNDEDGHPRASGDPVSYASNI